MNAKLNRLRPRQEGATAVEFALVVSILLILMFGIIEFGRVLYYMNAAAEATRWGARCAVVSNINDARIKNGMINRLPLLSSANISINYLPSGCSSATCRTITVSTQGATVQTFIPFIPFTPSIPPFSTTLPRESMDSISNDLNCRP